MKKLINQIKEALSKVFGGFLEILVDRGQIAIKVTNIVKDFIENPAVDLVVALTPNKKDDVLLARAKVLVPKILVQIGMAMAIVQKAEAESDPEVAYSVVLSYISTKLPEDGKAIFYRELSGRVAQALSDGNISTAESIVLVQLIFKNLL
jgi:hypothetical protein